MVKLEWEQKADLDIETKRKIFAFSNNLANEMAKKVGYSLSMILSSYVFSVLITRDYFMWANPLIVIGFLFFSGILASAFTFKIESPKEVLDNKDENK